MEQTLKELLIKQGWTVIVPGGYLLPGRPVPATKTVSGSLDNK
jgi:hypothetical protein